MLSYSLDSSLITPLYEQLYMNIKNDILTKKISANTLLPSKRNLSKQLSISIMTIETAYNQLLSEGYIYSLPRKGYYVSEVEIPYNYEPSSKSTKVLEAKEIYSHISPDEKRNRLKNYSDFTSNATDPATFPFSTWAKINRRILSEEQELLMSNSPSNGTRQLRTAIADYLRDFRGLSINPDNIVVGAGTETIYSILIQLLGYDKIYGTEDPGYEKISLTLGANNVKTVKVPIDSNGIIPEYLERNQVDIMHSTPSHHFPTGITTPISRRYELLNWANNNNNAEINTRYLIEDDYDSEFRLSGLPIPSLYSIDRNERVIYMNTFTKSLASTIRISYMVLPDHLMNEYYKRLSFYSCPVSTFEQLTLARFMSEGYYEKHINRMRTASRKKRDIILKIIKSEPLNDITEISEEQSGLHFILKVHTTKNEKEIINACYEKGIIISTIKPSIIPYVNPSARKPRLKSTNIFEKNEYKDTLYFMINYSSIPLEKIEESINILNKILIS